MDQKEFERLTRACDYVLHQNSANHGLMAISWLHVLNVHPNSIQQYQHALKKRNFLSAVSFMLYNIAYAGYKTGKSLFEYRTRIENLPVKADILFVSHLVNDNISSNGPDFYYGDLPSHVERNKGFTTVTGLIDHTPKSKKRTVLEILSQNKPAKYLFPKTLSFREEIRLVFECFSLFRLLKRLRKKETDIDIAAVMHEAAYRALAPDTFYTMRIYKTVDKLIKKVSPANLVITWEGRAWERMALFAAGNSAVPVKCIGYQHTILLSSSHSVKRSLGYMYDPDVILTLGEITTNLLSPGLPGTSFNSYGSYRLTFEGKEAFNKLDKIVCLVAPEGLVSESVLLFGLAVDIAKKNPAIDFIFRMHPVLPFSMFTKSHPEFRDLPSNCMVSDFPSMNDDLVRCNFLLYRASSVALYAVMNGLKPVYYNVKDEMPIDSLFLMNNWRSSVQNSGEFLKTVEDYLQTPASEKEQQYSEALAFCRKYVIAPDETVFLNSLVVRN